MSRRRRGLAAGLRGLGAGEAMWFEDGREQRPDKELTFAPPRDADDFARRSLSGMTIALSYAEAKFPKDLSAHFCRL